MDSCGNQGYTLSPAFSTVDKMNSGITQFCGHLMIWIGAVFFVGQLDGAGDSPRLPQGYISLFDGKSLHGWNGPKESFRIEEGAIVGGQLLQPIPKNQFLTTEQSYTNFILKLKFKLVGDNTNAGVQFRSQRIPNHHEMIGYQADLGQKYWGALYDESRRNKILSGPELPEIMKVIKLGEWNDYTIRANGKRIQLTINGMKTVDYTETDDSLEQSGLIGLQIHSGQPGEAWYKDIMIQPLP